MAHRSRIEPIDRPRSSLRPLPHHRWLVGWLVGTLALVTALIWLAGADRTIGQTIWSGRPINLHDGQTAGQLFTVPADGLHRIDLMFISYVERRPGSVVLRIVDETGRSLTDQEIDSWPLRDTWYGIDFPPLGGIAGRPLRLELERDSSWRSPIGVRFGPGEAIAGHALSQGEPDEGLDLTFRAYLTTPPSLAARWERVVEVARTLTLARPGLFGQPVLPLLLGGLYAAGLAGLGCLVAASLRRP